MDKDTVAIAFELQQQSINKLAVLFEKKPKHGYTFKGLPQGVIDVYETTNDSLNYKFTTRAVDDYGSIVLDIKKETKHPVIIQLLSRDEVVKTAFVSESTKVEFTLLDPKEYTVRAIIDENNNRAWDTGNFLLRKQPEQIIYLEAEFKLRANWVQNETFLISDK